MKKLLMLLLFCLVPALGSAAPTQKDFIVEYFEPTTSLGVSGFQFKAVHSQKCFSFKGVNATQEPCTIDPSQIFDMLPFPNNVFQLKQVGSGKCVQVTGGATANRTEFQLATCDPANGFQRFHIGTSPTLMRVDNGQPLPGQCVNVSGGNNAVGDGNPVRQYICSGGLNNEMWEWEQRSVTESPLTDLDGTKIYYHLVGQGGNPTIVEVPATAKTGGGKITKTITVTIPEETQAFTISAQVSSFDESKNESIKTDPATAEYVPVVPPDTEAPARPTGLKIIKFTPGGG